MVGCGSLYGSQLPPGFRFHPTDQELIIHYLKKKLNSSLPPSSSIIADIDLYKFNPWELPDKALFGENEWFFFTPRDRKYPNGVRPNRSAACGYWKATGIDKPILANNGSHCLGVKKALVFYKGRPPKGTKTDWVMHEYRLLESNVSILSRRNGSMLLDDWVLCRVRYKGSILTENNETPSPSPPQMMAASPFIKSSSQFAGKERSSHIQLSDSQLMGYLFESVQADSACESSELLHGEEFFMGEQQRPELVTTMLSSIKRSLSFGALDELMMLPPGKKMHHFSAGDQLSPKESGSDDMGCLEFLI